MTRKAALTLLLRGVLRSLHSEMALTLSAWMREFAVLHLKDVASQLVFRPASPM